MTNDDAISKLKNLRVAVINDNPLGSLHGMYEALNMAIEALKREKWISVYDYLPDENSDDVIFQDINGNQYFGQYLHGGYDRWKEKGTDNTIKNIIAWHDKPEKFKGENNDNG